MQLLVFLVVVIFASAAIYYFRRNRSIQIIPEIPSAEANFAKPETQIDDSAETKPIESAMVAKAREKITNSKTNYTKKTGQLMLPNGRILTFKPPKDGEVVYVNSAGRRYECDSEGNWKDVTPKPIFSTPFENQLVGLSVEGATFIPAFLKGYNQDDVVEILKRDVVINEDDPEDVVLKKQAVCEMKAIILDYIEQGGAFDQFVDEMYAFSKQERSLKAKGMGRLMKIYKAGDIEGARKFRKEYDEILKSNGFTQLRVPTKIAEILATADGN